MLTDEQRAGMSEDEYNALPTPGKDFLNAKKDTFISYVCKHAPSTYQSDAEPKAVIVIKGKNGKDIKLGGKSEAEKQAAAKAKKKKK
jgi:hypothetical protein